jgi:hypothetical protein
MTMVVRVRMIYAREVCHLGELYEGRGGDSFSYSIVLVKETGRLQKDKGDTKLRQLFKDENRGR